MAVGQIDSMTLATVWHSFQSICKEMRHVIERTAQRKSTCLAPHICPVDRLLHFLLADYAV